MKRNLDAFDVITFVGLSTMLLLALALVFVAAAAFSATTCG